MTVDLDEARRLHRMRYSLYLYASRAFAKLPDGAFFALVKDESIAAYCGAFSEEARRLQAILAEVASAPSAEGLLHSEFSWLFSNPVESPVPAWESAYVPIEYGPRMSYEAAGYESRGYPHDADDFLATELCFMATLAEESLVACREGDRETLERLLNCQRAFLVDHLGRWVGSFASAMQRVADISAFYPTFALFCVVLCMEDPILSDI